ncbi:cytochrome P450 [Sanghuangporus baumii]|uniref:Cytochrome P450 n=1 Tax=Sanghuangporus baumii TaxID=108892 RepID=A0A9Q5N5T9_SANBA|nr:cytochrome P450 [Sanghuangporus baumii]
MELIPHPKVAFTGINALGVTSLCVFGLCVLAAKTLFPLREKTKRLPPGPKPKPLIGNLRDLPPSGQPAWLHWTKHKDLYGPISSVTVFGTTLVILNDRNIAAELLDKRSVIYSSRPKLVFGGELVGWEHALPFSTYSERFRAFRKFLRAEIGTKSSIMRFTSLQDVEVRRFLLRLLEKPEGFLQHIRTMAGAIILKISYGYTIEPRDKDPLVDLADQALDTLSHCTIAGAWIVDTLPFLKYIPSWVPGMTFKHTAAKWRKVLMDHVDKPVEFVKRQMAAGINAPSYTSSLLAKGDHDPEHEFIVKWSAQSLYGGGADTTVNVLQCLFLAMMVYPEVLRKAQAEIDSAVGNDRLPDFNDRQNLPYIEAILKELLRWHPIGPLGFAHVTTEDDVYDGYFIPKGALVIANIWWYTHDPDTYHDPMAFKPERFLGEEPELNPANLSFGFGRRICPGRELADASLYLTVSRILATFNIGKPVENGKIVEPVVDFTPGAISHPVGFKVRIKARSGKAEALIRSVEEEHPFMPSDAETLRNL